MQPANFISDTSCTDGRKDKNETDADCGGNECPPCRTGERCKVNSDCQSGVCKRKKCRGEQK